MSTLQQYEKDWMDVTDGRYEVCCDCGLTHDTDYRILEGRILQRAGISRRKTISYRTAMKRFKKGVWARKGIGNGM